MVILRHTGGHVVVWHAAKSARFAGEDWGEMDGPSIWLSGLELSQTVADNEIENLYNIRERHLLAGIVE